MQVYIRHLETRLTDLEARLGQNSTNSSMPPSSEPTNNAASAGLRTHLGWADRLNGPVDNRESSCLSCHSTAMDPQLVAMAPSHTASDATRLRWFENVQAGAVFGSTPGGTSLDYSLQLAMGIQRFRASTNAVVTAAVAGRTMGFTREGQRVYPVGRDEEGQDNDAVPPATPVASNAAPQAGTPPAAGSPAAGYLPYVIVGAACLVVGWLIGRSGHRAR